MIYFQKDFLTIEYDEKRHCGVGHWKGFVEEANYKMGLNKVIEMLKEKEIHNWVADLSEMEAITPELQDWANTDWFPRAAQSGLINIAVVVSSDIFNQLAVEEIMSKSIGIVTSGYFESVEKAKDWFDTMKK